LDNLIDIGMHPRTARRDALVFGFAGPALPLAVVVAADRWDDPPRMRHQVTRQLLRWFNVLFVEFLPGEVGRDEPESFRRIEERLVVWRPAPTFRVSIRLYANIPAVHGWVNRWYRDRIVRTVRELRAAPVLLFNFVYHFPEIMEPGVFQYKAYFCFDELPRMWRRARRPNALKFFYQSRLHQHYENCVARKADRCLTPHYPLRDKLEKVTPKVDMLFHAHDYVLSKPPSMKTRNDRIDVAFAGYINWRLLGDWLLTVTDEPEMRMHLIGPVEGESMQHIVGGSRMVHVPPVPESELLGLLRDMDVLVMPYDPDIPEVSILTTNSKTFQYVAAGRPSVISDLPHYITLPSGVIYKARTAQEFVDKIRQARREDCEELVRLRLKIAAENTWDKRGDMLRAIIEQDMKGAIRLSENG
jgi:glycosyltransferase involved in cell wall biosynthesis